MDKKEINPKLIKELQHLQDVPERGLQASHAGRENYLAQMRILETPPGAGEETCSKGTSTFLGTPNSFGYCSPGLGSGRYGWDCIRRSGQRTR